MFRAAARGGRGRQHGVRGQHRRRGEGPWPSGTHDAARHRRLLQLLDLGPKAESQLALVLFPAGVLLHHLRCRRLSRSQNRRWFAGTGRSRGWSSSHRVSCCCYNFFLAACARPDGVRQGELLQLAEFWLRVCVQAFDYSFPEFVCVCVVD